MQRAHAISNGVFVCAVNRVGHEHGDVIHDGVSMPGPGDHTPASGLEFWGGSFIADPFGRILAQASHDKEEILTAELDPALVEVTRQHWPFLRDRRIDAYGGITSRFIDLAIRVYWPIAVMPRMNTDHRRRQQHDKHAGKDKKTSGKMILTVVFAAICSAS